MKHLHVLITLALFSGCVSLNLPQATGRKATTVNFEAPETPFSEIKSESADRAWISGQLGNTISFLSYCENPADPSLQQLESDSLNVLTEAKILNTRRLTYNGREALETLAEGQVDGVPVRMKYLIFKKNNCNYTLLYGGVAANFSSEAGYFETFVKGFKAP